MHYRDATESLSLCVEPREYEVETSPALFKVGSEVRQGSAGKEACVLGELGALSLRNACLSSALS